MKTIKKNMEHSFNIAIAKEYGVLAAVLIRNFQYWISKNKSEKHNFVNGHYWTFNSTAGLCELFPYMSKDQINRQINMLVEKGVLIKGHFSENPNDRRTWIAFSDDAKWISQNYEMDLAISQNGFSESAKCINDLTIDTNNNPYNKPDKEKKKTYTKDFEDAWEAYKRKGNKKDAYIQWQKLTDEEKEAAAIHIPFYVRSREIQYLKDFQRYLSHHQFEEVVRGEKGEDMFDPSRTTAGEYNPDNSLHSDVGFGWDFGYVCKNEHRDPYKDMIFDGYTNDTRPDGALLYFKNGLRYHRWDAQAKVWRKVEGHWDREKRMFIEEGQQ